MVHVAHTGTLTVDAPPERALYLFTGPGEELWVDGWQPDVLSGDGLEKGSVFVTNVDGQTIWIVVEFNREELHARYARVTPGSRAGTVDVRLAPDGAHGSRATISYELTGLSEEGNALLIDFDAASFQEMLASWERAIAVADIDLDPALMSARP